MAEIKEVKAVRLDVKPMPSPIQTATVSKIAPVPPPVSVYDPAAYQEPAADEPAVAPVEEEPTPAPTKKKKKGGGMMIAVAGVAAILLLSKK